MPRMNATPEENSDSSDQVAELLRNVVVVLVDPQGALNIGSVCRAMMNFGFGELRLVAPQVDYLGDEGRRMAVKAAPLLEGARQYADLAAALADCSLALGTTRRFGKYREDFLHPHEAASYLLPQAVKGRVALVFGREDHGLYTAELDLCQRFITIPTRDELPSMNLAQAVSLCLYAVAQEAAANAGLQRAGRKLASHRELESLYAHMRRSLLAIGFLDPQNPDHILHTFRRIFGRAGLNPREVKILHGMMRSIDWVDSERRRREGEGSDD
ncbi:tRNA (2'O-methyl-C32/U32)-methyltransferase [Desulfuromonas sp. DDH964]|nr:tRNA (2'O-methyl-C32/U32)-methyltransferase [Desulfuromonas sp. DDH964]